MMSLSTIVFFLESSQTRLIAYIIKMMRKTLKTVWRCYSTIKDQVTFTPAFNEALQSKLAKRSSDEFLRLEILSGEGCEGFTYKFKFDQALSQQDYVALNNSQRVVFAVGEEDLSLMKGATIDYVKQMMREVFEVKENPNAQISCSCKTSFSPKDFVL